MENIQRGHRRVLSFLRLRLGSLQIRRLLLSSYQLHPSTSDSPIQFSLSYQPHSSTPTSTHGFAAEEICLDTSRFKPILVEEEQCKETSCEYCKHHREYYPESEQQKVDTHKELHHPFEDLELLQKKNMNIRNFQGYRPGVYIEAWDQQNHAWQAAVVQDKLSNQLFRVSKFGGLSCEVGRSLIRPSPPYCHAEKFERGQVVDVYRSSIRGWSPGFVKEIIQRGNSPYALYIVSNEDGLVGKGYPSSLRIHQEWIEEWNEEQFKREGHWQKIWKWGSWKGLT